MCQIYLFKKQKELFWKLLGKFSINTFSRVWKLMVWGVVTIWWCKISFWIPWIYVFMWCKYRDGAPISGWDIAIWKKILVQKNFPQGKFPLGVFWTLFTKTPTKTPTETGTKTAMETHTETPTVFYQRIYCWK